MKTFMSPMLPANQNTRLTLLDWSGEAISSRYGQPLNRPKNFRPVTVPALRIVPPAGNEDLFKYASAAKARSGYWETIVFTGLGVSAAAALATALFSV
jgi:hypothetical protein